MVEKEYVDLKNNTDEDSIDLIALAKTLWSGRRTLIWSVVIFMVLGLFIALFSPVEYTADTIMVPQITSEKSKLGGLSSLAAMAGFNLDAMQGGASELSPLVYPKIVQSIIFQKEIMYIPLTWEKVDKPVSLFAYYDSISKPNPIGLVKKYTLGLPGVVLGLIRGKKEVSREGESGEELIFITEDEKRMREMLKEKLTLDVNEKEGYITLTAKAPEAFAAAQMARKAQKLLQDKVTEYKIDKAKQNLVFVQELYKEKKHEFEQAQDRLARFRDRNLNLNSAMALTEQERLQSEYQLAFSVYTEVAKQLENAKIKVKEDTPVFSIIEPVSVPIEKSKPKKAMILIIWIFLGGLVGVGLIFGKNYWKVAKEKWREEE